MYSVLLSAEALRVKDNELTFNRGQISHWAEILVN